MELMAPLKNIGLIGGLETTLIDALHDLLDVSDEQDQAAHMAPSRTYVREAKAMSATPADVKETHQAYIFVIDVPGLRSDQIKVQLEDDNVLVVTGERKREKEKDEHGGKVKYLRMERRLGKYLKKFVLPENADTNKISAECRDGVLTVAVEKAPPPEPRKPKVVEVRVASSEGTQLGKGGQLGLGQGGQGSLDVNGTQGAQWDQVGQGGGLVGQGGGYEQQGQGDQMGMAEKGEEASTRILIP